MSNDDNDRSSSLSNGDGAFSSSPRLVAGAAIFGSAVALTLGLTAPFVVLKTPLPYMATPGHKVRRALQTIGKQAKQTKTHDGRPIKKCHFVDLGSGDGEAVYQAARYCNCRASGYEINWTLFGLSHIRRLFWARDVQRHTSFYCKDFFQTQLPIDTSMVMIFGVKPLMEPLSKKLALELVPNSYVLSYRFMLPINQPGLLQARIVYDHEEMRVYEVQSI